MKYHLYAVHDYRLIQPAIMEVTAFYGSLLLTTGFMGGVRKAETPLVSLTNRDRAIVVCEGNKHLIRICGEQGKEHLKGIHFETITTCDRFNKPSWWDEFVLLNNKGKSS